jgi:phosphatidylglycerol:prolipoprotein diacylglycerol transferase
MPILSESPQNVRSVLIHPQFNPVALSLGPLSVHWYGLMYLLAFLQFWWLGRQRILTHPQLSQAGWTVQQLDDLLFYGVLGVIAGGRLGQVLLYEPGYYLTQPLQIFAVWRGGMSFHGGFLGVLLAMGCTRAKLAGAGSRSPTSLRRWCRSAWLPGASATLSTASCGDVRPIHPCRGQWFSPGWTICRATRRSSTRPDSRDLPCSFFCGLYSGQTRARGAVSGVFLIGYGVLRWIAEYFRSPDEGIFGFSYTVSMGQWLSLPMIVVGIIFVVVANRQRN